MNSSNHPFQDSLFKGMDPEKLQFILSFAQKEKPKSIKDAMPFLLANMNIAKKKKLNFSSTEIQLIAEILSKDLPANEKERIQKIISTFFNHTTPND